MSALRVCAVVAAWVALGCDRSPTPQPIRSEQAPSATSASSAPTADPAPAASAGASEPAVVLGPAPSGAARTEREKAVLAVLAGEGPLARLPEMATEPGQALDLGLRDTLAPRRAGGRIRLLPVAVTGKLPVEVVTRVLRSRYSQFRACYDRRLGENPLLQGRVTLELAIDAEGKVTRAANAGSDLPDPVTVSCFVAAARRLVFPKPEGEVKATAPFVLELAGSK
ncbi:MAG: AgmX/PglI C-terminal domain-containing protein [Polyangiaceae bacterium]|nr:AgmX/PglI C-terminal domain-containing protein [Polyangiaceae bacterium]